MFSLYLFLPPSFSAGLEKIEDLQGHPIEQIYRLAYRIIDVYFDNEDTVSGNQVPQQAPDGSHFLFNSNSNESPDGGFNF